MADPSTAAAGGNVISHSGLATIVGGWLLSSEAAIVIGIVMSIAGYATNVYFKRLENRRRRDAAAEESRLAAEQSRQITARAQQDAEYHAARMAALQAGRVVDEQ